MSTCRAVTAVDFDLVAYAKKHRYRVRNLHDGGPVPPAVWNQPAGWRPSNVGEEDRWDAIVGYRGYVAMDGDELTVTMFFRSNREQTCAAKKLGEHGATIQQDGDLEIGAIAPISAIEPLLKLIKVSKLPPGRVENLKRAPRSPDLMGQTGPV
jgi:hypothetical protein